MKKLTHAALLCAAITITLISCQWLSSTPSPTTAGITGKWTIDSVTSNKQNQTNDLTPLLNVLLLKDSVKTTLEFGNDSIATYNDADTAKQIKYYISTNDKAVFINDDSSYLKYNIAQQTATALRLQSTGIDSSVLHLTKK